MMFITGKWIANPIYLVTKLGIPSLILQGTQSSQGLAAATCVEADKLERLLRALGSVGILAEVEGTFSLTPLGELLLPGRLDAAALLFNEVWSDSAWISLEEGMTGDATPFEIAHGAPLSTWLSQHPYARGVFSEANRIRTCQTGQELLKVMDFSKLKHIVDIRGGDGTLLRIVLERHSNLTGTLDEHPAIMKDVSPHLPPQISGKSGDYLSSITEGGDCDILSSVFTTLMMPPLTPSSLLSPRRCVLRRNSSSWRCCFHPPAPHLSIGCWIWRCWS